MKIFLNKDINNETEKKKRVMRNENNLERKNSADFQSTRVRENSHNVDPSKIKNPSNNNNNNNNDNSNNNNNKTKEKDNLKKSIDIAPSISVGRLSDKYAHAVIFKIIEFEWRVQLLIQVLDKSRSIGRMKGSKVR